MAADPPPKPVPLDEIQWNAPPEFEGGIHNNSVLYYFAQSPFYDKISNNEVVFQQGLNNPHMMQFLATREQFEGRLRTMSGLEFMVAQEPAETGPGAGTGVWVINKQYRRKVQGEPDEVNVLATYFIVGEYIHMAPSFADIMSARLATISSEISKTLPLATSVQSWSPSGGRVYNNKTTTTNSLTSPKKKKPEPTAETIPKEMGTIAAPPSRLFEEALFIHDQYGDQFQDENPITGRPGEFHLSSTGRQKANPSTAVAKNATVVAPPVKLPAINTKVAENNPLAATKPTGKETKSPRTPGAPKLKRRKSSKAAITPS
ncbi:putative mediator of RNA polymerase II transcription subunit 6 [Podospora australis]|uniref:Mediator of RNA polymerase II transcription subunit 6 n=1 Tax=Podospora australis TaxID=1536484 RepID=A0AAN6X3E0_9PEZI|nr:putative mediator of RNA polymerase II transcription subunit 6 [Podospora australis]